uniref:caspase family protein n=1 Tax=Polynucleobacter sp. TaxID=2029855 RepID=UPI004048050A
MKKIIVLLLTLFFATPVFASQGGRIALIIGNSKYQHLNTLPNAINDAKEIDASLKKIGFSTSLLIDSTDATSRRELRKFSEKSENASIALVFYAGHGAQVNGENFILPVDIEIPNRESDIQLSSIKVDDVINSLRSKTKVVFLDACRDNPALLKSLSKGRGAFRGGLAPAKNVLDESSSGLFIAYATDAGNVALDGVGSNSPFTSALIKHIDKPISIDDMFSFVTREVRQSTKNQQRPYKYASLDGVVCLTGECKSAESTKESSSKISSTNPELVLSQVQASPNWVLINTSYDNGKPANIIAIQPSSIRKKDVRAWGMTRWTPINSASGSFRNLFSTAQDFYDLNGYVYDCRTFQSEVYRSTRFNLKTNAQITDDVVGIPETLKLRSDYSDKKTVGYAIGAVVCSPELLNPISGNVSLNSSEWLVFNTVEANTMFLYLSNSVKKVNNGFRVIGRFQHNKPVPLNETIVGSGYPAFDGMPTIQNQIFENIIDCSKKSFTLVRSDGYNEKNDYVINSGYLNDKNNLEYSKINDYGFLDKLHHHLCEVK